MILSMPSVLVFLLVAIVGSDHCKNGAYEVVSLEADTNKKEVIYWVEAPDDDAQLHPREAERLRRRKYIDNAITERATVKNHMLATDGLERRLTVQLASMSDPAGSDAPTSRQTILESVLHAARHPAETFASVVALRLIDRARHKIVNIGTKVNRASDIGQVFFYVLQIYGLCVNVMSMVEKDANGTHTFPFSSAVGVLTLMSATGESIGTAIEPFLVFEQVAVTVAIVKANYNALSSVEKAAFAIRSRAGISNAAKCLWKLFSQDTSTATKVVVFKSPTFTKFMARVKVCALVLMVPLTILDVVLSSIHLADAVKAYRANEDADFDDYYKYVVAVSAAQATISYVCAILVGVLLLGDPVSKVVAAISLFVLGIVSIAFIFWDNSAEMLRLAQLKSERTAAEKFLAQSCEDVNARFVRYGINLAHEMDYLEGQRAIGTTEPAVFDLRQSWLLEDLGEPYVSLDKIVIEERRVVPTLSHNFVRQLQIARPTEIVTRELSAEVQNVVLPTNMFSSVGMQQCLKQNDGLCEIAKYYNVHLRGLKLGRVDFYGFDDPFDTPPDVYCRIYLRGRKVGQLQTRRDERNPSWTNLKIYFSLAVENTPDGPKLEKFGIRCYDYDGNEINNSDDKVGETWITLDIPESAGTKSGKVYNFGREYLNKGVRLDYTYEVFGAGRSHYEWIAVPTAKLSRCFLQDVSFNEPPAGCELRCDNYRRCNAFLYEERASKCNLVWCRSPPTHELTVREVGTLGFVRKESVNCGGQYVRSCADCDSQALCVGQCHWAADSTCRPRRCGECKFPFVTESSEGEKHHWGCIKRSGSSGLFCPTAVNSKRVATMGSLEKCPDRDDCKQPCNTYVCSQSHLYVDPAAHDTLCDGDCTDAICCIRKVASMRRQLGWINQAHSKLNYERLGLPDGTEWDTVTPWIKNGLNLLRSDIACLGAALGGYGDVKKSLVFMAEPGYLLTRSLEVVVDKDSVVLQTAMSFVPPRSARSFEDQTGLVVTYDIKFNGRQGTNRTDPSIDSINSSEMSSPLRPLQYTLTLPALIFADGMPVDRTSSFSYILHKTSLRDTILFIDMPDYARQGVAGYLWGSSVGILQNSIVPFAQPLANVNVTWSSSHSSKLHKEGVRRYRKIQMGTVVNDRITFFLRRGTHQCQINHIKKTYMLEAIVAQDPSQPTIWETERWLAYHHQVDQTNKNWRINFRRSTALSRILTMLEEYRQSGDVNGFKREERPVQVLLGKTTEVTFYYNAISGPRAWSLFVPRLQHHSNPDLDYRLTNLDDTFFSAQKMHSYNLLSTAINVTYVFPSLGTPFANDSSIFGLVTIWIPFAEDQLAKVIKVVCPICKRPEVVEAVNSTKVLDVSVMRIVNTHTWEHIQLIQREKPLSMYSTAAMRATYFPYDPSRLSPLGYFATPNGVGCILARTVNRGSEFVHIYRASPVFFGDEAKNLTRLRIPSELQPHEPSYNFRDISASTMPGCEGIVATAADYSRYCLTCLLVVVLELHNRLPTLEGAQSWQYLDYDNENPGDTSGKPPFVNVPLLSFFEEDEVQDSYQGRLYYQSFSFRFPPNYVERSHRINSTEPWSADPQQRRYIFQGVVRMNALDKRPRALWLPINRLEDGAFLCPHRREGFAGRCKAVEESFEALRDFEEIRIVEHGIGTWVLQPATSDSPYELVVDRVVNYTADALGTRRVSSLLLQPESEGSSYYFRGCDLEIPGTVSLLSRRTDSGFASPILGFFVVDNVITQINDNCTVSKLPNVYLGEMMTSHSWITDHLHLHVMPEVSNGEASVGIPRVLGYTLLSVTFGTVGLRKVDVLFHNDWIHAQKQVDVSLHVPKSVEEIIITGREKTVMLMSEEDTTSVPVEQTGMILRVVRAPDIVTKDDARREANIEALSVSRHYKLFHVERMRKLDWHCLPYEGKCEIPDALDLLLSHRLPSWRRPQTLPEHWYLFEDAQYGTRRSGNFPDLYVQIAISLHYNGSLHEYIKSARQTSLGRLVFCPTEECAISTVRDMLGESTVPWSDPVFMLHLVSATNTSAKLVLWPDMQQSSAHGYRGGALMELHRWTEASCGRKKAIPPYAVETAKRDPEGFARVIEQIYFEEVLNPEAPLADRLCVRVSSAYASLAMRQHETLRDSVQRLMQLHSSNRPAFSDRNLLDANEEPSRVRQTLLSRDFSSGGEVVVDMRLTSVFSLIESLVTFLGVAKKQRWNLSHIKQQDVVWSLAHEGDFLYFERYGGISLRNWPENILEGPNMGSWNASLEEEGSVFGPLLKRLLALLPMYNPETDYVTRSALKMLHQWGAAIRSDFHGSTMENSIAKFQHIKSTFPNIEQCVTPVDPGLSASRYLVGLGYGNYSMIGAQRSSVGRFRIAVYNEEDWIDDTCEEYVLTFHLCDGNRRELMAIEVRYNGIDWEPSVEGPTSTNFLCNGGSKEPVSRIHRSYSVVSMAALKWTPPNPRVRSFCPANVRIRLRNVGRLCQMKKDQDPHIRAAQWYTRVTPRHYVGTTDARYSLHFNGATDVHGIWGLYYNDTDATDMAIVMQWFVALNHGRACVDDMLYADIINGFAVKAKVQTRMTQFVVEDPLLVQNSTADVVIKSDMQCSEVENATRSERCILVKTKEACKNWSQANNLLLDNLLNSKKRPGGCFAFRENGFWRAAWNFNVESTGDYDDHDVVPTCETGPTYTGNYTFPLDATYLPAEDRTSRKVMEDPIETEESRKAVMTAELNRQLEDFSSTKVMVHNGWKVDCGNGTLISSVWHCFGNGTSGSISATLSGYGAATLRYENCAKKDFVTVKVAGRVVSSAAGLQTRVVRFSFNEGNVLEISTKDAILAITSLEFKIGSGKCEKTVASRSRCAAAASAQQLSWDTFYVVRANSRNGVPAGCYYNSNDNHLYWNPSLDSPAPCTAARSCVCEYAECPVDRPFPCGGSICIRQDSVCDGFYDCQNGSDEEACVADIQVVEFTAPGDERDSNEQTPALSATVQQIHATRQTRGCNEERLGDFTNLRRCAQECLKQRCNFFRFHPREMCWSVHLDHYCFASRGKLYQLKSGLRLRGSFHEVNVAKMLFGVPKVKLIGIQLTVEECALQCEQTRKCKLFAQEMNDDRRCLAVNYEGEARRYNNMHATVYQLIRGPTGYNCDCGEIISEFRSGLNTVSACHAKCIGVKECRSFGLWTGSVLNGNCRLYRNICGSQCRPFVEASRFLTNEVYDVVRLDLGNPPPSPPTSTTPKATQAVKREEPIGYFGGPRIYGPIYFIR